VEESVYYIEIFTSIYTLDKLELNSCFDILAVTNTSEPGKYKLSNSSSSNNYWKITNCQSEAH
jgi:hypothetical protein